MMATPSQNEPQTKNILHKIRGLPVSVWFNKETVEEIFDFMPGDGDVIIATYPKTGTTWMQYIVVQILTKGEFFPPFMDLLMEASPFLEMAGVSAVEAMTTRPRVYKHHIPYDMMKKNPNTKIIYMYRKPEDAFLSYYHFTNNLNVAVDLGEYFEDFLTGNVSCGQYFKHILSYLEHKNDKNMLFVSYEKLHIHRKEEILRVAKFLGEEYFIDLVNDESFLNKIIKHTSFAYMQKNLVYEKPKKPLKKGESWKDVPRKSVTFFRRRVIGDGKKSLKESQMHRLKELAEKRMKGTDILLEWFQD